ncbi:MAG: hypothetical protein IKP74_05285 [Clostridia bacterium]|nr:hypothetical protein [Clostridia bacterium]
MTEKDFPLRALFPRAEKLFAFALDKRGDFLYNGIAIMNIAISLTKFTIQNRRTE